MEKEGRHLFWLLFTNRWMSLLSHWDLLYFPVTLNLWCNPAVCFASLNFPFQHLPPCDDITLVLCVFSWVVCCHWLNFLHMLFFVYNVLLRFVISSFLFFLVSVYNDEKHQEHMLRRDWRSLRLFLFPNTCMRNKWQQKKSPSELSLFHCP